ncbi:MAG: histidine phosphatase family protein [Thermodesulfovibrionales bacterium]
MLYLIRHGQTVGGHEKRYKGHLDVPLSEEGERQMRFVADHISEEVSRDARGETVQVGTMEAVYCSDLSRALRSAEIIAGQFNLKPLQVVALRERSFGSWEGMSFEEIRAAYPEEFGAWTKDPSIFSPVGGESTSEVRERVIPAVERIVSAHAGGRIAIVSHGGVLRVILCEILSIPLRNIFRLEQNFGCLNVVAYQEGGAVVRAINLVP